MTESAGLPAYEISNHAAPGAESRHNLIYWQGHDYVGIGPGAHGRLTDERGCTVAVQQHKAPDRWLTAAAKGDADADRQEIAPAERRTELIMMGLRLTRGLSSARFARLAGLPLLAALEPAGLRRMVEGGFLTWSGDFLQATPSGRRLLNQVLATILP
jgi:oxygen-independent coproporphyrinogen-3 oxidase